MVHHLVSWGPGPDVAAFGEGSWGPSIHPIPEGHSLGGLGFDLLLESRWETAEDQSTRWPTEGWKGVCASLLAYAGVKKPATLKDSERVPTKREQLGREGQSLSQLYRSFCPWEPGTPCDQPKETGLGGHMRARCLEGVRAASPGAGASCRRSQQMWACTVLPGGGLRGRLWLPVLGGIGGTLTGPISTRRPV